MKKDENMTDESKNAIKNDDISIENDAGSKNTHGNDDEVKTKHDWIYAFTEKLNHAAAVLIAIICGLVAGFIVFVFASHSSEAMKAVSDYINGNMMIIRVIIGIIGGVFLIRSILALGMLPMISDFTDKPELKIRNASDFITALIIIIIMFIIPVMMIAFAVIGGAFMFALCLAVAGVIILIYAGMEIASIIRERRNARVTNTADNNASGNDNESHHVSNDVEKHDSSVTVSEDDKRD